MGAKFGTKVYAHGMRDDGINEPFLVRFCWRAIFYIFLEQFIGIGPVRIFFVRIIFCRLLFLPF